MAGFLGVSSGDACIKAAFSSLLWAQKRDLVIDFCRVILVDKALKQINVFPREISTVKSAVADKKMKKKSPPETFVSAFYESVHFSVSGNTADWLQRTRTPLFYFSNPCFLGPCNRL